MIRRRGRHRTTRDRALTTAVANWGVVAALLLGIATWRHVQVERSRAPLPVPNVTLARTAASAWSRFPTYRDRIPVLLYHGINTHGDYLSVPQRLFAQQMLALHEAGFHTIDTETVLESIRGEGELPANPILITFDDGELSSYRGADRVLERYGFQATMFVVPAWVDTHPAWALSWDELAEMEAGGRWDIQEHAGRGHRHVVIDDEGREGEFYAYERWLSAGQVRAPRRETFEEYAARVERDVAWGRAQLQEHVPGYRPIAFAVPYSNFGQRATNDPRIPPYFLAMVHRTFPLVFDGDYLNTGPNRPFEQKTRSSAQLIYRIQQGPVMTVAQLYCRLHAIATRAPIDDEYAC